MSILHFRPMQLGQFDCAVGFVLLTVALFFLFQWCP